MDKYTATEQAYKNGYEKGYAAGKPKWIPVSEGLPDTQEYDWVLVAIKLMPEDYYGVPCVAELRSGSWYDAENGLLDTSEEGCGVIVTHWMTLPSTEGLE